MAAPMFYGVRHDIASKKYVLSFTGTLAYVDSDSSPVWPTTSFPIKRTSKIRLLTHTLDNVPISAGELTITFSLQYADSSWARQTAVLAAEPYPTSGIVFAGSNSYVHMLDLEFDLDSILPSDADPVIGTLRIQSGPTLFDSKSVLLFSVYDLR